MLMALDCHVCGRSISQHRVGEFCRLGPARPARSGVGRVTLDPRSWQSELTELVSAVVDQAAGPVSPWVVARTVLDRVEHSRLLELLLVDWIGGLLGRRAGEPPQPGLRRTRQAAKQTGGSAKWRGVASVMDRRVRVAGVAKPVGELTAVDCDMVADGWSVRAAAAHERAEQFRRLGKRVREAEVETVRQLGETVVAEILEGGEG